MTRNVLKIRHKIYNCMLYACARADNLQMDLAVRTLQGYVHLHNGLVKICDKFELLQFLYIMSPKKMHYIQN